jgi:pyrroline-5-carboxylate reductase
MSGVLFVGGGKMMQAIAQGLIARGRPAATLAAIEPDAAAAAQVAALGAVTFASAEDAIPHLARWSTVVLAVKPQFMQVAITPFSGRLRDYLILSIAAGTRVADIARWVDGDGVPLQLVRAMPNTPALIRAGVSGAFAGVGLSERNRQAASDLLNAVGKTIWFDDEAQLDAVTAVSGSGPAYVFFMIEALESAAIAEGIDSATARVLAIETFRGASLLAAASADPPAVLRANVTSRGGTTAAALNHMEETHLARSFAEAVHQARLRAKTLGDELGKD